MWSILLSPHSTMNETCHTCEWVMSHIRTRYVTRTHESCHTHEWIMSHPWMSHVTHTNESCHTHDWVTWYHVITNTSHLSRTLLRYAEIYNASWYGKFATPKAYSYINGFHYTYAWVVSHMWATQRFRTRATATCLWHRKYTCIWMSHVTHMNETSHTCVPRRDLRRELLRQVRDATSLLNTRTAIAHIVAAPLSLVFNTTNEWVMSHHEHFRDV